MANSRRFPPPWSIEDIGAAYVVALDLWLAIHHEKRSAFFCGCEGATQKIGPPSAASVGHSLLMVGSELLLFRGIALSSAPRLTSHLASVAPRLTSLVATGAPRLTSFVATGAPRLTPVHTGRCWSCGRWSGCLCLSLSI